MCPFEVSELSHDHFVWHELVKLNLVSEFPIVDIVCAIFLNVVNEERLHERLLCRQSVCSLFSLFIFFEFYEFYIAEWHSEDSAVPDRGVLGRDCNRVPEASNLVRELVVVLDFAVFLAECDLFGQFEVDRSCSVEVLLNLIDFEVAVDRVSILGEGKGFLLSRWEIWKVHHRVN